eukprot:TRINITY_DN7800_c0_g1_i1.p1 TRINITY_DN7800_c0_g1~~TRINITY_DN7800_c0_g1_i1.p1  ORF type:complete len:534 (-),score=191.69 TRINITY_DN7800_c0_g1_i1:91-1692(-)
MSPINDSDDDNHSGSSRSGSRSSHHSGGGSGAGSNRSRSPSVGSQVSGGSGSRARSGSPAGSNRSRSPLSAKSRSSSSASSTREPPTERKDVEASEDEEEAQPRRSKERSRSSSSGSDVVSKRRPSENENPGEENVGTEDIFGDDLSISSDEEGGRKMDDVENERREGSKDRDSVQRYDDDDDADNDKEGKEDKRSGDEEEASAASKKPEEDEPTIPETRIDVEVPKITTNLGKEIHFVKLPNFLSVDARPFDPETYEDEIEDEDSLDEEGRARLKLKVENTIRWKIDFDKEGKPIKKSNARFVKWSDGSLSLHLGSEVFDVYKQPLQGDFNHLFIRQGTGLQGQAVFRTKLSFRPYSTESFTHQKMTRSMADRSNKATGIKVISSVGKNPEMNRWKRMKEEEERLRASLRRDNKQKRVKERSTSKGLSGGFLEDGSDEEGVSLSAIKNKYKKGRKDNKPIYTSDEDDSDIDISKTKKLESAKSAIRDSDEESKHSSASSRKSSPRRSVSRSRSPSRSRSASRSRSRSKSDSD